MTDIPATPDDQSARDRAGAALAFLSGMTGGAVSSVVLMVRRVDGDLEFAQLVPTERALPALNGVVQAGAETYSNSSLIDYDSAATTADDELMWIRVSDVAMLQAIADGTGDPANMPLFDPATARLAQLKLAAMRVTVGDTTAVFIQSLTGNQIVARSRNGVGMIIRRGMIDAPPRGDILLFSREIAAVIVDDIAFFKDRAGFQRIFGFLEEMRQQATATFASVTKNLRIEGLDEMAIAVTRSPQMLGKMASIQRKLNDYPQYVAALTMRQLVDFVGKHPECSVDIVGEGDDARLVFVNDVQHRFKILKLLDDDYLQSQLTTLDYATNSKSSPVVR